MIKVKIKTKNTLFVLVVFMLFLSSSYPVHAVDFDPIDDGYQGEKLADVDSSKKSISDDALNVQLSSGSESTQRFTKEQINEKELELLRDAISDGWDIVTGLFILYQEAIMLLFRVFEMRIVIFILLELIPSVFFRIRDGITRWFVEKRQI